MLSLWDVLGVPSTRVPIDVSTMVFFVIPPIICYFVVAVLAVTPQTCNARVALWPLVAMLALRATFAVDMSLGNPEQAFFHAFFVVSIFLQPALLKERTYINFPSGVHV